MNGPKFRSGFSLVEILVVIGVVGILISIIVPALRGARGAAGQTVCLSNLRGVGMTFGEFTAAHRGQYPFPPEDFVYGPPPGINAGTTTHDHWQISVSWPSVVAGVAPWRAHYPSWVCPGSPRIDGEPWNYDFQTHSDGRGSLPSYTYSHSFVARPQLWSGSSDADESLLQPVWESDVAHPSSKVMVWDSEMAHLSAPSSDRLDSRPMLFADGHAGVHRVSEAREPVQNPLRSGATPWPFNDTRDGVQGRDY